MSEFIAGNKKSVKIIAIFFSFFFFPRREEEVENQSPNSMHALNGWYRSREEEKMKPTMVFSPQTVSVLDDNDPTRRRP